MSRLLEKLGLVAAVLLLDLPNYNLNPNKGKNKTTLPNVSITIT